MEACVSGKKLDRVPVAMWRHFPVDDQTGDTLAAATGWFQRTFDFDFIKVTPASSYCIKDWGSQDKWMGNPEGTRDYEDPLVQRFDDWRLLKCLNPQKGQLGESLACLKKLVKEFGSHTPIIHTIFSPLSQAKNLVGKDNLLYHMRACPEAVHIGLKTITETTIQFIHEAQKIGIDGVFFAVQHAQYDLVSMAEYEVFCRHYDLQILRTFSNFWLNIGHIHGNNIMFDQMIDYPVAILNWHDRQTSPSLSEAQHRFSGVVCGGLRQWETMVLGSPESVKREASDAIQQTQSTRFVLGTGCVLPITTPFGNIQAALRTAASG